MSSFSTLLLLAKVFPKPLCSSQFIRVSCCLRRHFGIVSVARNTWSSPWWVNHTNSPSKPCFAVKSQARYFSQTRKNFFWGMDAAFNKVDKERVQLAGSDRACAEWVLRNGGVIKWTTSSDYLRDFNLLPTTEFHLYKLEEIDLSATDVVAMGFLHLENLKHLKVVRMHGCRRISNESLVHLLLVTDTLQEVEVSLCPMITAKGLQHLTQLKNLRRLTLYGLIEIKDLSSVVADLKQKMPHCQISTEKPEKAEEED